MNLLMMKTVNEVYRSGVALLEENCIDDAEFDARCLIEYVLDIDTTQFMLSRQEKICISIQSRYFELINKRISGMPLQYILGSWEFMGHTFVVGEGVLIPRPETEMLVDLACEYLESFKNKSPIVVDFCSGSGCIAISIAKRFPDAEVYAVEKYAEAYRYLKENILLNNVQNVTAINGDLFDKNVINPIKPDLILSNPPYIRKSDIPSLSKEVLCEPHTALDGGNDGYDFYRFLCNFWFGEYLADNSAMMLECAEDQGDCISEMFAKYTDNTKVIYDFNGLQRIVTSYK